MEEGAADEPADEVDGDLGASKAKRPRRATTLAFASERTDAMEADEYDAFVSRRQKCRLACSAFGRVSTLNLLPIGTPHHFIPYLQRGKSRGRKGRHAKVNASQTMRFLAFLSASFTAEIVEAANRRANGGVLRKVQAALSLPMYEQAEEVGTAATGSREDGGRGS